MREVRLKILKIFRNEDLHSSNAGYDVIHFVIEGLYVVPSEVSKKPTRCTPPTHVPADLVRGEGRRKYLQGSLCVEERVGRSVVST